MKFLILFALAFGASLAKDIYSRSIEDLVLENEGRVSSTHIATPDLFKYQVGLHLSKVPVNMWCGGSLINENWVLTAAHCTSGAVWANVYLGSTKRLFAEICYYIESRDIIIHPLYNPSIYADDVSLIKIPTTHSSSKIGFVTLPNNDDKYLNDFVVISGWGETNAKHEGFSDDLRFGILKVSRGELCSEHFGLLYNNDVQICVDTPEKVGPCKGDSGGPLVLVGKSLQIGLYSFFYDEGCEKKLPTVFARVSAYKLWIMVRTGIHS